jgi:hypothetical protein
MASGRDAWSDPNEVSSRGFCFAIGVSWAALVVQIHPSVRANASAQVCEREKEKTNED